MKPLTASLRPSRRMALLLLGMHAMAAALAWLMPLDIGLRLIWLSAVIVSLAYHGYQDVLRRARTSVHVLHLAADGILSIGLRDESRLPVEVLDSSFVEPWLTVLHLRPQGRRSIKLVLLPDMLPSGDFRRLRVWLRLGRKQTETV